MYGLGAGTTKDCYYYTRNISLQVTYNFNAKRSKYKGTGAGNEEKSRLQLWVYGNSLLKIRRMTIGQAKAYQQKVNEPLCLTDVLIVGKLRITAYL